jgi:hypothetical protein
MLECAPLISRLLVGNVERRSRYTPAGQHRSGRSYAGVAVECSPIRHCTGARRARDSAGGWWLAKATDDSGCACHWYDPFEDSKIPK